MAQTPAMKINPDRIWRDISYPGNGVEAFTCFSLEHSSFIGVVWVHSQSPGQGGKTRAEIIDIYVPNRHRRKGVGLQLFKEVFDTGVDVLMTQIGSDTGGLALLQAAGFHIDRATGTWVISKRNFYRNLKRRATQGDRL